jgi:hypothetical protein
MQVNRVLSELHSELEQIEQQIRSLERFGAEAKTRPDHGPRLCVCKSERLPEGKATPRRGR